MTKCGVVGLGEAGVLYARGFRDAGFDVVGYDPFTKIEEEGIRQSDEFADVVEGAAFVVSLVGARAASHVADDVFRVASPGLVYADLNTGSPQLKAEIAERAAGSGVRFVDVAVLAPVPRDGAKTPLMVSGDGAAELAEMLNPVGTPISEVAGGAGAAAARKLVRSAFMKGLAAVVIESVGAAKLAGCEEWLRGQIASELAGDVSALIDRLIDGSKLHAARRVHEAADTRDYLDQIGQPHWSTDAAHSWLTKLLAENAK
jgi:3-hydroxyisobutyrate dehydrogenase-like beta-hydroxyacid dehydrogenase